MPVQRGRKSGASLAVVSRLADHRPAPPTALTAEQQAIWRRVVDAEPGDTFKTAATQLLLEEFCRHATAAATLARLIDAFEPEWMTQDDGLARYAELLKLRERETKAMAAVATKLRLTNQSRYTPQAAGTASRNHSERKPWEPIP